MIPGLSGWPEATMYRHHFLAAEMPETEYVFLIDADMLVESLVGPEILPENGITATIHPGYPDSQPPILYPYERNPDSAAFVGYNEGNTYFCGGFIGGTREAMLSLCTQVSQIITLDVEQDICPVWHDESALNRVLINDPPEVILSPAYCCPQDSSYYETIWPEKYLRKITALDKTQSVRGNR